MRFSTFAGVAIVPLLARLVLVGAFLPQGAHKVFTNRTFDGRAAEVLAELGVGSQPSGAKIAGASFVQETRSLRELYPGKQAPGDESPEARPGQSPPAGAPGETPIDPESDVPVPAAADPFQPPVTAGPAVAEPITSEPTPAVPIEARSLYGVAYLLVEKGGWPADSPVKATHLAWAAALTELVGGGLLLVGLFSRIWGLGLAITMGFAYALTSWRAPIDPNLFAIVADVETFNRLYCQLGLLVLGLGVFLTGPGPLSLDRVIFGSRRDRDSHGLDEHST